METKPAKYSRILIATDDSECSKKALEHGHNMARIMESSVALIHVIEPAAPTSYGADPLMGQQPIIIPETTEIQEENSKAMLEEISKDFLDVKEVFTFSRVGNPKQEILAVAEEWAADLIITGTHGRTGFDHFISGSVSESVVRRASCPVLVVPSKC
ncbi:Nucleotide-binding universal stress protein, UspA family [Parapedobacter composti]|uniref:Universal stress protein n=1 Tax=Parapedobacter composti TaxID=623281 RepID=A0A1I1LAH4_9SPHI|nr:universal stress protein [Parapedobacter composti]SFC70006.1 Nucleotide-binding universal stress protein, UspA family [Parapedobacter composti]